MRTIDDGDVLREYNTRDLVQLFQAEILAIHKSDVDDWEADLMTGQYAYVKFGLLLERIRNGCWWNRCKEKFSDFRAFCQSKINLNIWQVINAIKSANVAVRLANLGFDQLPRNASQALKLAELSMDRLAEVWGNVVKSCKAHKITALAIESQINPDKQPTHSKVRLPSTVADRIYLNAARWGLSVEEYLTGLIQEEDSIYSPDNEETEKDEPASDRSEFTEEQVQILDALDRQFQATQPVEPKKIIEAAVDSFDRLMNNLIGQFIPPVKTVANE
jgi:hypothetical protein